MIKKIMPLLLFALTGIGLFISYGTIFANSMATLVDASNWQCNANGNNQSSIVTSNLFRCYNGNYPTQHSGAFFYADKSKILISDLGKIQVQVAKTKNSKGFKIEMYYNASVPPKTYTFTTKDALTPGKTYYILFVNSGLGVSTQDPANVGAITSVRQ